MVAVGSRVEAEAAAVKAVALAADELTPVDVTVTRAAVVVASEAEAVAEVAAEQLNLEAEGK